MQPARSGDPFIGSTVPSELRPNVVFRVERRLGEGATAIAYFASRFGPEGTSPAVLKIIQPSIIVQAGDRAELIVQKEAVALGRINERVPPCPAVVRLLDTGAIEYAGRGKALRLPWLALEYVHGGPEGGTLAERVGHTVRETGFAFGPERALGLLDQVTEGLTEIHAAGVIHRDLNPNNVLCCGSGASEMFKISDFGIARSLGMHATLGTSGLGTPGYVAPEQLNDGTVQVDYRADLFSLGALFFYALTGEDLFPGSALTALLATRDPERRSILTTRGLAPEIRSDPEICAGIDQALLLSTAPDAKQRPATPRAFAASLKPWLTSCPPTRRTAVPLTRTDAPALPRWTFNARHPRESRWLLLRLGWDSDGHCLAATTEGLAYFDGTAWNEVPSQNLGGIRPVRFVSSAGAGRWLIGGDGAVIAEYSRLGVTRLLRGDEPELSIADACGELSDLAAAVATRPGSPPLLVGISGGRWLKPLPVPEALSLTDLTRLDETHWLVAGRGTDGQGLVGVYAPLRWEFERLPPVNTRALVGTASRRERELGLAVGAQGAIVRVERGARRTMQLPEPSDLASAALDVLGAAWAGGAGTLWFAGSAESGWVKAWADPEWRVPFVSIFAEPGRVVAATADGAILEGRALNERASTPP
jgi:eukaryotic-like serine/threonine-protein kinase